MNAFDLAFSDDGPSRDAAREEERVRTVHRPRPAPAPLACPCAACAARRHLVRLGVAALIMLALLALTARARAADWMDEPALDRAALDFAAADHLARRSGFGRCVRLNPRAALHRGPDGCVYEVAILAIGQMHVRLCRDAWDRPVCGRLP